MVTGRGLFFLMGGAFSPNTTEMIDLDSEEDFVESFPLVPGRISHCAIQVSLAYLVVFTLITPLLGSNFKQFLRP